MIAIISDRHFSPNRNGNSVCMVTCPGCDWFTNLTYGGWTAIICGGCKSILHRNRAVVGKAKRVHV